ncbi:large ribosomal subunit protein P1-like [Haematobia irritans]|uniref:large ribosomal subunit protein P1-like n=1 Tax=Haematobia irritans TaxID=7368 RepID=UPI003F509B05
MILEDDDISSNLRLVDMSWTCANFVKIFGLFAKDLEGVNVKHLITNIGSGVGAAPAGGAAAPAGGAAPAAEAKKEEKKKEEEPEESDDEMGLVLFD